MYVFYRYIDNNKNANEVSKLPVDDAEYSLILKGKKVVVP